jgi:uncharacterized membrane protein YkgB
MKNTITYIRIALGIIFLWYGILKFFPQLSPAETLAITTIDTLFVGFIAPEVSIKLLASWEMIIGVGLLLGVYLRIIMGLFLLHMALTFTPLFLLPELSFSHAPYAFTLVGQYIVKNVVFILAGILIYQQEQQKLCISKIT